jgi:hypothetical protein
MTWPQAQDYNEALQSPSTCFADPELNRGEPATNALGLPVPCSGSFADVYRVTCPASRRTWAVKCFTREIPGLRERYQQISLHLQQVKLPFLVDFTFLDQGIQIRRQWYPIVKMQWVEGCTLNQFVERQVDKPQILNRLCQIWTRLAACLPRANVAHCDLQHGNILLAPGSKAGLLQVRLVDYDGTCVPALTLLKSIERGHSAYQHPERLRAGTYGLGVDRFSHLVIYTALRALMVGGKALWAKYDNGDNLLFTQRDFEAPAKSRLFYELLKQGEPVVRTLADRLIDAARQRLEQTPLLSEIVPGASLPPARPAAPTTRTLRPVPPKIQPPPLPPPLPLANASPPMRATATDSGLAEPLVRTRPGRTRTTAADYMAAGMLVVLGLLAGLGYWASAGLRHTSKSEPAARSQQKATARPEKSAGKSAKTSPDPLSTEKTDKAGGQKDDTPGAKSPKVENLLARNVKAPPPSEDFGEPEEETTQGARDDANSGQLPPKAPGSAKVPGAKRDPSPKKVKAKRGEAAPKINPPPPPARNEAPPEPPEKPGTPATAPGKTAPDKATPRLPVPSAQEQQAALMTVKERFKDEYKLSNPKSMQLLATRLRAAGVESEEGSALQFMFLWEARSKAAEAGDPEGALRAVDELAKRFDINTMEEKTTALERARRVRDKAVPWPKELTPTVLALADEALAADNYAIAERLLAIAVGVAKTTPIQKQWNRAKMLLRQWNNKVQGASQTLKANPEDPEANLTVGMFYCFHKEDWDRGLALIAKANHSPLAALAKSDRERPTDPHAQAKLGEEWARRSKVASEAENRAEADAAKNRARYWFEQALPHFTGPERKRIQGQMNQLR